MFSHVMLGCSDRERSRKFYDATMGVLGHRQGQDFGKLYLAYLRDPDGNKVCGFYRMPNEA